MPRVKAWSAPEAKKPLGPTAIERRDPRPRDVVIDVLFCGVCHSDIHQARDEWSGATFPMVPGHEIVGKVARVGKKVKKFKVGDNAGVGCFVESCGKCASCKSHEEQYCEKHRAST